MITSIQNPRIQWLRLLQHQARQRRTDQTIVIEGVRLAEEALHGGWHANLVIYDENLSPRGRTALEGFQAQGAQIELVSEEVLHAVSDTQTPQGLLAALEWQRLPLPPQLDFIFIPDQIHDPGNLGTMLRTAAAAGVQAVFLPPETTDAFAPKALRAGMGAQFCLPINTLGYEEIGSHLQGLQACLAAADQGSAHTLIDFCQPTALIIGSEAQGASPEIARLATYLVHIPMPGGGNSLNASVAAGILLFEVVRQRLTKP